MKKRILSIVLAVLMLVSVMPVPAMAATMDPPQTDTGAARQLSVSNATADDSVHIVKSVNEDGTALTLEAYATNTMTTVTTYEPLDIVLVLDVSGSMRYCINCDATYNQGLLGDWYWSNGDEYCPGQPEYVYERQGFAKDLGKNSSPLYRASRGGYSKVEWCNGNHYLSDHQPGWYEGEFLNHSRVSDNTILYKQVKAGKIKHQHRIDALKAAVGDFIDSVAAQKDSDGNTIDNRISLVTFASNANTVEGLTSAQRGSDKLKAAVIGLTANGATQADLGMKRAQSVLDGRTGEDETRKSVVILFTDGEPTSGSSFESSVASGAITAAKDLKAGGTTIFTVGIFEGANPSASVTASSTSKTNKYMHAVSSNYPGATYKKTGHSYNWNFGDRATGDYYLAASDANGLNAVFQAISNQVGSLTAKIDETSVLSDTLSEKFDFAPDTGKTAKDCITVKKVPVTDKDANGNYTWDYDKAEDITQKVEVSVVGTEHKTLKVEGFDYGTNAVTTTEKDGNVTYKGYKLVVTIPIKPDPDYHGWADGKHYYDTNAAGAGLTYGDKEKPQHVLLDGSPNAPVTGYTVSYQFTNDGPESAQLPKAGVYIKGQQYKIAGGYNVDGWTFTGWCSDRDCTTTVSGQKPMGTADVTYYGMWTKEEQPPETATLSYEFKSGDDTITTLPQGVLSQKPADSDEVEAGTDVTLPSGFTEVTDTVNKGKWTFVGWYTDDNLSAESKITGDTYPMPEGGKTLYGKWTFTKDEPKETTYTIEYYRQNADGEYPDYPDHRKPQPGDPALTGTVGSTAKVTDVDQNYVTHYDADGYKFDAENEKNVLQCTLQADASKNVLRLYYKALPKLEVKKEVDEQYNVKHGDTLTYTITVKNAGARNLTNVEVTDVIDAADPSKLEILSGEGYAYNEESGKIEIGRMEPGDEVVIKATYVVQEADSGNTIMNTAFGSANEVEVVTGTVKAYPNEIEEFNGDLVISKTYRSDTSTSPAATFYFDVYYMDGDEQISLLDEYAEISFDKNEAKKGAPATKTVEVTLNDVNEKVLESGFYVREVLEDKVDKVVYDRNAVHGFLVPFPQISAYADTDREPITVDQEVFVVSTQVYENADAFWAALVTDELDKNYNVFSFTNTYKTVRTEPVKVGPQLNRDDHVAYIMGYPDGTVQPEGEITRAEACTIFFRLLTDSSRDYYFARTNDYSDVNAGDWFNNAISTLSNAGIVTGYNDGTFRPNQPITRGEMAKIIANFANLSKGGKSFTDLRGHWSKTYVELAAGNGWIAGYPDGSFRPDQKITRAETVTMINRVLERVPAKESRLLSRSIMLTFPDNNPGDWYYIAIQEASNSHEYQRSVYETTGDEMWTKLIDNVDWTKLEK